MKEVKLDYYEVIVLIDEDIEKCPVYMISQNDLNRFIEFQARNFFSVKINGVLCND